MPEHDRPVRTSSKSYYLVLKFSRMFIQTTKQQGPSMRFLIFPNGRHNGEEGRERKKKVLLPVHSAKIRAYVRRLGQGALEARRRNKTGVELARGGSDFVHCHCNFLAGRSFRGVTHHGGITYRWLFVRTSPSVIICLVTRPLTRPYICPVFPSIPFHFHPEPPLSLCFEPRISTLYRRI